jgi:hypothetical protein
MRRRYRRGCLRCTERKAGPHRWEYLWRENDEAGKRVRRTAVIGIVEQYNQGEDSRLGVLRSIYLRHIGACKTEASRKPVPLDQRVAADLWLWKETTRYRQPDDWIFASPPYSGEVSVLARCCIAEGHSPSRVAGSWQQPSQRRGTAIACGFGTEMFKRQVASHWLLLAAAYVSQNPVSGLFPVCPQLGRNNGITIHS